MDGLLRGELGFAPSPPWLAACLAHLGGSVPGFASQPPAARLQLVLEQLLAADLRAAGAGGLLPDVAALHKQPLAGRFLLQVDEAVNIAAAWRDRWADVCAACARRRGASHALRSMRLGGAPGPPPSPSCAPGPPGTTPRRRPAAA